MRAVYCRNGRTHWVLNEHLSVCGRQLIDLPVEYEYEPESIQPDRQCAVCERMLNGGDAFGLPVPFTLPPSHGTLFKEGPLNPSPTARRHGQQLQ